MRKLILPSKTRLNQRATADRCVTRASIGRKGHRAQPAAIDRAGVYSRCEQELRDAFHERRVTEQNPPETPVIDFRPERIAIVFLAVRDKSAAIFIDKARAKNFCCRRASPCRSAARKRRPWLETSPCRGNTAMDCEPAVRLDAVEWNGGVKEGDIFR